MRILIVGGTGFMGPHVVERLERLGHEVVLFHRGQTKTERCRDVAHLHGDARRLGDFVDDFRRIGPEVVLNMIAFGEHDARTFVGAFAGVARRAVVVSSQDVYRMYGRLWRTEPGPPDPVPIDEDAPLREKYFPHRGAFAWAQDYEKILVEQAARGVSDLPATILRLPMVYGPGDGHRIFPYLKRMDDRRPVIPLDEILAGWRWSRAFVENVALAIARAVVDDRAAGRTYNVAEPVTLSEAEWVREIGKAAGWCGEVVAVPEGWLPPRPDLDRRQDWVVDTARIREELGYREIVPRSECLRQTVAWERAHPPDTIDPASFDYLAEDAALHRLLSG